MQANGMLVLWTGLLLAAEPLKQVGTQPVVAAVEKKSVQYQVDLKVAKADANGRDLGPYGRGNMLAEPRLVTLEGRNAAFFAGGQLAPGGQKDGSIPNVPFGTSFQANVTTLSDGRVRLNMTLEISQQDETQEQGVVIVGTTIRAVKALKLGELVKLTVPDAKSEHKFSVWVWVRAVGSSTVPCPIVRDGLGPVKSVKVGEIKIIGNTTVDPDVIRRELPFYPGQTVTEADLRLAEKNLERTNLFRIEPDNGIHPTVEVLSPRSESEYKDVLITVEEKSAGPGRQKRQ